MGVVRLQNLRTVALMMTLSLLSSCQSFRPMPATEIAPGSWVRVASPQPFILYLRSSADSADLIACTINRFQGRLSSSNGDTLVLREISMLGFVGTPDGRCTVRSLGFVVRGVETAPAVGMPYIDANRTVAGAFLTGAVLLLVFLIVMRDGIG